MDGLKSRKDDNIIVIGATNRPFDLDDAILRRLPRRLLVDLPGEKERAEILKILLRDETLAPDVDLKLLAKKTDSFSGSDLKRTLRPSLVFPRLITNTNCRSLCVRSLGLGQGTGGGALEAEQNG